MEGTAWTPVRGARGNGSPHHQFLDAPLQGTLSRCTPMAAVRSLNFRDAIVSDAADIITATYVRLYWPPPSVHGFMQ